MIPLRLLFLLATFRTPQPLPLHSPSSISALPSSFRPSSPSALGYDRSSFILYPDKNSPRKGIVHLHSFVFQHRPNSTFRTQPDLCLWIPLPYAEPDLCAATSNHSDAKFESRVSSTSQPLVKVQTITSGLKQGSSDLLPASNPLSKCIAEVLEIIAACTSTLLLLAVLPSAGPSPSAAIAVKPFHTRH